MSQIGFFSKGRTLILEFSPVSQYNTRPTQVAINQPQQSAHNAHDHSITHPTNRISSSLYPSTQYTWRNSIETVPTGFENDNPLVVSDSDGINDAYHIPPFARNSQSYTQTIQSSNNNQVHSCHQDKLRYFDNQPDHHPNRKRMHPSDIKSFELTSGSLKQSTNLIKNYDSYLEPPTFSSNFHGYQTHNEFFMHTDGQLYHQSSYPSNHDISPLLAETDHSENTDSHLVQPQPELFTTNYHHWNMGPLNVAANTMVNFNDHFNLPSALPKAQSFVDHNQCFMHTSPQLDHEAAGLSNYQSDIASFMATTNQMENLGKHIKLPLTLQEFHTQDRSPLSTQAQLHRQASGLNYYQSDIESSKVAIQEIGNSNDQITLPSLITTCHASSSCNKDQVFIDTPGISSKKPKHGLPYEPQTVSDKQYKLPPKSFQIMTLPSSGVLPFKYSADNIFHYIGNNHQPGQTHYISFARNKRWRDLDSEVTLFNRLISPIETPEIFKTISLSLPVPVPNPIWPSRTALAIASNDVITLRPFRFWQSKTRTFLFKNIYFAQNDELKALNHATDGIFRIYAEIPRKEAQETYPCSTIPIVYKGFQKTQYLKLQQVGKEKPCLQDFKIRVNSLLETILFLNRLILQKTMEQNSYVTENKRFLDWLTRALFDDSKNFPVYGVLQNKILKHESEELREISIQSFGIIQKLFIFFATSDRYQEILDSVALSLLGLWYNDKKSRQGGPSFKTYDEFWKTILTALMKNDEFGHLQISFWTKVEKENLFL
ncbi:hypothetical protein O181_017049 [Austropuccinia psidii MF-1]|uniref:Uncharacterized protein n=1 Tax=Austropuccinia psidii MF-1 TaxID=1389203 RepID=A0A9Q3C514_9BASI|nr:hypothetical protein [Austropuccinia psidii MF-1]